MKIKIILPVSFFTLIFCLNSCVVQADVGEQPPAETPSFNDPHYPESVPTVEEIKRNKVRQGRFAQFLVRNLGLVYLLPLSASELDCTRLLNRIGISPLKGWDRQAPLTHDDYVVVMGKIGGREKDVHNVSQEVCDRIVKIINLEWGIYYTKHNQYPVLETFLKDNKVFPNNKPICPYGVPYILGEGQPQILSHNHIIKTPLKYYLFEERTLIKLFD